METTTPTAPAYMKVDRELYQTCEKLVPARSAKLMRALMRLFFDGIEPGPGELPHEVMLVYNARHSAMVSWRNSVKNGSKNDPKPQRKTYGGFEVHTDELPADTSELGTHPTPNPRGALGRGVGPDVGTPINKHESQNMNQMHSSDEDGETGRQGNAASLPAWMCRRYDGEGFRDICGGTHPTYRDAVAASFEIKGYADPDGYLAKVATTCGADGDEPVDEIIAITLDAVEKCNRADPWPLTKKMIAEDWRTR